MPTLITSALGGEADIPRSRSGVRYDPRVDLEENRHVFLIRPSLLRILVSLLLELGRNPPKPLRYKGSLLDVKALSLQIGPNLPAISQIAGRDGLASDCQHSHLVAGIPALSRDSPKTPEEARNCATSWRSFSRTWRQRARFSARTPRFFDASGASETACGRLGSGAGSH
jgi:hypothetical protein